MRSLSILLLSALSVSGLYAAGSSVYPVPQTIKLKNGTTQVQRVVFKKRQADSSGGMWDKLPADKEGGYALQISPGKLEVWVNDSAGAYYAKQTLSQLLVNPKALNAHRDPFAKMSLDQVSKQAPLPQGLIIDWPDLPYRGVVEGYYGTPWGYDGRVSLFEFMGRNKMNTYLYAPKDDPYHHGGGCYKPYPEEKAKELRELVKHARENHVRFVWAIHPANTVRWNQNGGKEQLDALCTKLEQLYELGVRDFGVLVDDSGGEICRPERQAELCNYILHHFIRKHPDVSQKLIMCPTGYNRSWTNEGFLNTLGSKLDKDIFVMWTGDTVVHDITLEGQKWVNKHVQRPTFIWWNWPCSDFKRSNLSMGRCYGNSTSPEMKEQMSGFVSNPMEQAEANKVGLFGVADYTWNIEAFDSDKSWKTGIKRLYPQNYDAMQVFCNHNSYLLPNGHGYYREEAVEIQPAVNEYLKELGAGKPAPETLSVLRSEYARIAKSAKELLDANSSDMKVLQKEISSWFKQFELTGKAGICAMDAMKAKKMDDKLALFFEAQSYVDQMKNQTRPEWNGGNIKPVADVRVASLAMSPALNKSMDFINRALYAKLSGVELSTPVFTASRGDVSKNREALDDDNLSTFWEGAYQQNVGDWYCLDFGSPIEMSRINLLMGGPRAKDFVEVGQFEVSNNGRDWKPVGDACNGPAAVLNLADKPVKARMVRFRVVQKRPNWLSICEFSVNRLVPPYVVNNLASKPNLRASVTEDAVMINRVMEIFPIRPGESISLETPALVEPKFVEINTENPNMAKWARIELVSAEGEVLPLKGEVKNGRIMVENGLPKAPIAALRLTNAGSGAEEIKVTQFRIGLDKERAAASVELLTDGSLATGLSCDKAIEASVRVPAKAKEAVVVGSAECTIENAKLVQKNGMVATYSLSKGDKKRLQVKIPKQPGKFIQEIIFK